MLLYGRKPAEPDRQALEHHALTPGRSWMQLGLHSAATLRNQREIEKVMRFLLEEAPAS